MTAVAAARNNAPKATQVAATRTYRNIDSVNWGTEKGQATLDVIEDQGEEIYSENYLEYKVTLTPSNIQAIKKYNDGKTEGFLDKSLKCTVRDKDMEYVTCSSEFLALMKTDSKYGKLEVSSASSFKSIKEISNYVSGYNVVSERKSGTGPAWK